MKNPRTQFELHSKEKLIGCRGDLITEYEWCIDNLPLKEDRGIIYNVNEIYIITRSERIIEKVNRHFGSQLSFDTRGEKRWFI